MHAFCVDEIPLATWETEVGRTPTLPLRGWASCQFRGYILSPSHRTGFSLLRRSIRLIYWAACWRRHRADAPDPSLSEKDLKRWRRTLRGEARVSAAATNVPPVAPVRPWASRPPPAAPRQASASRPPPAAARASASPPPPFSARQAPISPPPPYRRTAGPAPVPTTHVVRRGGMLRGCSWSLSLSLFL